MMSEFYISLVGAAAEAHVGEMYYFWERGVHENRTCGCGEPFMDCSWWNPILKAYRSDREFAPADWMLRQHTKFARTRNFPGLWLHRSGIQSDHEFQTYTQELLSLYRSIQETTDAKFIVDSSKSPTYALILSSIPGIKVTILHLIRDPRGTGYSWRKHPLQSEDGIAMGRLSIFRNGIMWSIWNLLIEAMQKRRAQDSYMRTRYEDFASQPRHTVKRILNEVKIDDPLDFFQDPSKVNVGIHHTVAGNPARSKTGPIRIRPDREWIEEFGRFEKLLTTALTMPLLLRYGYPIAAAPDSVHLQLYP
jgi:hypothetical protein